MTSLKTAAKETTPYSLAGSFLLLKTTEKVSGSVKCGGGSQPPISSYTPIQTSSEYSVDTMETTQTA